MKCHTYRIVSYRIEEEEACNRLDVRFYFEVARNWYNSHRKQMSRKRIPQPPTKIDSRWFQLVPRELVAGGSGSPKDDALHTAEVG